MKTPGIKRQVHPKYFPLKRKSEKIEAWKYAAGKGLLKGNIFLGSAKQ